MRVLTVVFAAGAVVAGTLLAVTGNGPAQVPPRAAPPARTIAITVDDLPGVSRSAGLDDFRQMNADMLGVLQQAAIPAIGFVNENKLDAGGPSEHDARVALLTAWLDAGMALGNHTFSHRGLTNTPPAQYEAEILRGETVIRPLVEARGASLAFFRHPMTQTGPTPEIKSRIDGFLADHGYRTAPFTIEDSDYIFALIYDDAVRRGDVPLARRTADAYLAHQQEMFDWFEGLARETFDRDIPQILLIHVNRLHAATLGDEVAAMQARGYRFVSLADAMADAAYDTTDGFIGTYGPSWLHRWRAALDLPPRLRDEPDPPAWVLEAYERLQ